MVSTIAGKAGETGAADGIGSAARFGEEGASLAIGPDGVLYVSDRANMMIRKVTPDGTVTTLAGKAGEAGTADGKGAAARFGRLGGLAIDAAGTIYVADEDNSTIRKIAPDGTVTTLAGKAGEPGLVDGKGADARFNAPVGMTIDASGNLYVGSWEVNPAIRKITPDGTVTTLAGSAGAGGTTDGVGSAARFRMPWALTIDAHGVLWVVDVARDNYHSTLRKVLPDGTVTTVKTDWPSGQAGTPWVDKSGVLYFTSYPDSTITKMTPDGAVTLLAGRSGSWDRPTEPGTRPGSTARPASSGTVQAPSTCLTPTTARSARSGAPDGHCPRPIIQSRCWRARRGCREPRDPTSAAPGTSESMGERSSRRPRRKHA